MSNTLGDKTPAQTHNDLLYIPNGNSGVDSTARSVYSGNGVETTLKLGETSIEADFGKGLLKKPLIDSYHLKVSNHGEVTSPYQISTTAGNVQKITISSNINFSIISNLEEDSAFELILIVEQGADNQWVLVFPSGYKTEADNPLVYSANVGNLDVFKFLTFDGGSTWLVSNYGSNYR